MLIKGKRQKSVGLTLIETVVVMIVIAIILTVVLVDYRSSEKRNTLELAAQELVGDLRKAQNMALSSQKFLGQLPAGGYGIYLHMSSPQSYVIFADVDGSRAMETGEEFETISLPGQIEIGSLKIVVSGVEGDANPMIVNFLRPEAEVFIGGAERATIGLRIKGTSIIKNVTVLESGAIYAY